MHGENVSSSVTIHEEVNYTSILFKWVWTKTAIVASAATGRNNARSVNDQPFENIM